MSANLSSCSPTRVLLSRVLWGSGTRQSWVQKQRVEMPLSFIADWREAGSCWEHTLLRPGVGPGARTECCTGISWGDAVLARQARVCCPGLQPAVPGAALLHTARRPHPGLWGGGHGLCTRPPGWGVGAAILQEELWRQVPGVRPQHAAPREPVREAKHKGKEEG